MKEFGKSLLLLHQDWRTSFENFEHQTPSLIFLNTLFPSSGKKSFPDFSLDFPIFYFSFDAVTHFMKYTPHTHTLAGRERLDPGRFKKQGKHWLHSLFYKNLVYKNIEAEIWVAFDD